MYSMELTLKLSDARIDTIVKNLQLGRSRRPGEYKKEITPYWEHHLSKIAVERVGKDTVSVSGESGFCKTIENRLKLILHLGVSYV